MPNQPGQTPPSRFRSGQSLRADDLNKIVALLARRILGGKGIRVRVFGNRIVIDRDPPFRRNIEV